MKKLVDFIKEGKNITSFETVINKDNVSFLEKVVDYVKKTGEATFRFSSELGAEGKLLEPEVFDYSASSGERYKKL